MRVPTATYRLQFQRQFTFKDARNLVPYFRDLGISDLYASPIFLAGPDSTHGYDVCDYNSLNPDLGAREEFDSLATDLRNAGMGLLLDFVPNHMGANSVNRWWQDVLKNGPDSQFANYFDINWKPANPALHGKVLLPVLGDDLAVVLQRGELKIAFEPCGPVFSYFDQRFPISEESTQKFHLRLRSHLEAPPNITPDQIRALLEMQHYQLAFWRKGTREINYRRFFDVTGLVSMRVEDAKVFNEMHRLVFDLLRDRSITGLRVDHPDGLRDPVKYFERLKSSADDDIYVVAEKILSYDEDLPADWPVEGTTGYDFLNALNGLFVDARNENEFTRIYQDFTSENENFGNLASRSKREVLEQLFVSEIDFLTLRLREIAGKTPSASGITAAELRWAIIEFIAGFPVYRTYVTEDSTSLTPSERQFIRTGLDVAHLRNRNRNNLALNFLTQILSLDTLTDRSQDLAREIREFVIRFQQLSGPATAKGLEDTAFYRYARFISLNEVGGNPGCFGISPASFHGSNRSRHAHWPHSMLATATHDTKRGEDTRARLNVLSEMPAEWEAAVLAWRRENDSHKTAGYPVAKDEYFLYQTLVGTWPGTVSESYLLRIQDYMLKATREAKEHTSWIDPNERYESALRTFIAKILQSPEFVCHMSSFIREVARFGMFNSLAQVVLKIGSPGVPDFYQGTELWDFSLVDPDNRRTVNYDARRTLSQSARHPTQLLQDWENGALKLFTMANALRARRDHLEVFRGEYLPLAASGKKRDHVVAFARRSRESTIIVAVPRLVRTLTQGNPQFPHSELWEDTVLGFPAPPRFRNIFTGEEHTSLRLADLFRSFPVAILIPLH